MTGRVKVEWLADARSDLETIIAYVAVDSVSAAQSIRRRLVQAALILSEHPSIGSSRPDLDDGLRLFVVRPYLILYRTVPHAGDQPVQRVEIVTVVDGRRDPAGF